MALRLRDVTLHLNEAEAQLGDKIAALLGCRREEILRWTILRKGIDARRKPAVMRVYTLAFDCQNEQLFWQRHRGHTALEQISVPADFSFQVPACPPVVVVVGMGPAGLFCALALAEAGARVTLIERGRPVQQRLHDVRRFWDEGVFDPASNVQFGEGGAGTFSDGKLTTRLNHPGIAWVLARLVEFGAPADILYQAKPHVGSDRLRKVLVCLRKKLLDLGVDLRFSTRLSDLETVQGRVTGAIFNDTHRVACQALVLAPGHSARDTYAMLARHRVTMERKPFAIGVRVEHPVELINRIQYGMPHHPALPPADYRLSWNDPETGRGIYSFCMCPGGTVINAASEEGGIVVNGMSRYRRDAAMSNSALVVTVTPDDFAGTDPLAGVAFQRRWERAAWQAGEPGWRAPAQPLLEFLHGRGGHLVSTCQPAVVHADLNDCLPPYVASGLRRALPYFERKMRGFITREATLIGVETRTSAPLRIVRDTHGESVSHKGLFPAGEGAGYAGGIMSAALDGLQVARQLLLPANS
jgi:uncharacterized FAD-dependent dehydrogenase